MKKLRFITLLVCLCLLLCTLSPAAFAIEAPAVSAKSVLMVDMSSGNIIYSLEKDQQRAPASLTKIMTALLAFEALESGQISMDDRVVAQDDCLEGLAEDSSTSGILPGTELSVKELIYCSLLQSANEACNILGSYISGSVSAFVELMNQRAAELGCTNTHFVNPNGLPAEGHYSSAYDLYLITREAMTHPDFISICDTLSYQPESSVVNGGQPISNSNALICSSSIYGSNYLYEGASGVKTGYTNAAGYCLISTATKNDIQVLTVVMGSNGPLNTGSDDYENFTDTISLYNWVFDNFSYQTVLTAGEPMEKVDVENAKGSAQAILYLKQDLTLLLPSDYDSSQLSTQVSINQDMLKAPIAAGTVLGKVQVTIDGVDYGSIDLVCQNDIELATLQLVLEKLQAFFSNTLVIVILVLLVLFTLIYMALWISYQNAKHRYMKQQRIYRQKRKEAREELYRQMNQEDPDSQPDSDSGSQDGSPYSDYDYDEDYFNRL